MDAEEPRENDRFDSVTRAHMPEQRVVRLSLFRHGDVERMEERVVRGQLDVALSAKGTAQHAAWCRTLAEGSPPSRIFSSDLERCRLFAEGLSEVTGAPLELSLALREQHMGEWQGRTWREINAEEGTAINDYWADFVDARPPGGESFRQLARRASDFWRERLAGLGDGEAWVVTHAGVVRALSAQLLGVSLEEALRFAPPVATRTRFSVTDAGAVLEGFGELPKRVSHAPVLTAASAGSSSPVASEGPLRIALSGSAGTGKSTLARALSEELSLPYIDEGMRRRLEAGLNLHELDADGMRRLVRELWSEQEELERAHAEGFVADRSSLDYAAFWLHYGIADDTDASEAFLTSMAHRAREYSHVFVCPFGVLPLEADGVRSTNRWIQYRYQLILEGLFERELGTGGWIPIPREVEFDRRLASARMWIGGAVRGAQGLQP